MVSMKTFFSFCLLFGVVVLQVDRASGDDDALSTKLSKNLTEIFENVADVNWRALWAIYDTIADYLAFGFNVASKATKAAGTSVDYASRGAGHTRKFTARSMNYVGSGLQKGIVYLSKCMNRVSTIFQNYSQKLARSKKTSSRR